MGKENTSRYAILGVLSRGPMSGYALKKFIELNISTFWSESYGQIYPLLKQLSQEGLTSSHTEKQESKPERSVSTLTDKGWETLQQWLAEPAEASVGRIEVLLKLFFGKQSAVSATIAQVQHYRALQVALLQQYAEMEKAISVNCADEVERRYAWMTLSYGRYESQALRAWCDETLAILNMLAEKEHNAKEQSGAEDV